MAKKKKTVSGIAEDRMNKMAKAAIQTKGRAGTAEDFGRYSTKATVKTVKKAGVKMRKGGRAK